MTDNEKNGKAAQKATHKKESAATIDFGAAVLDGAAFSPKEQLHKRSERNWHTGHRTRLRQAARRDTELVGLSDIELVELLLSFFVPQKDTNIYAHILLTEFGSVSGILGATQEELARFKFITARAAKIIPKLASLCFSNVDSAETFKERRNMIELFGAEYSARAVGGTYVAYFDDDLKLLAVDGFDAGALPYRDIVGAVCKHRAKRVLFARRERTLFPQLFDLAAECEKISELLASVDASLFDFMMFSDYGYYTLGEESERDADWFPLYIFVPFGCVASSPDLFLNVTSNDARLFLNAVLYGVDN